VPYVGPFGCRRGKLWSSLFISTFHRRESTWNSKLIKVEKVCRDGNLGSVLYYFTYFIGLCGFSVDVNQQLLKCNIVVKLISLQISLCTKPETTFPRIPLSMRQVDKFFVENTET
jgi:hypothetical protein